MRPANPLAVPADTSPEVWRRQMDIIAAKSMQERLDDWATLNREIAAMEEAAVRRQYPDYDERHVVMVLVRRRHGDELAFAAYPDAALVGP